MLELLDGRRQFRFNHGSSLANVLTLEGQDENTGRTKQLSERRARAHTLAKRLIHITAHDIELRLVQQQWRRRLSQLTNVPHVRRGRQQLCIHLAWINGDHLAALGSEVL